MKNIKILVALHKSYKLPADDIYYPIQVGGKQIPNLKNALSDNTGENISSKNNSYCELTALFWAWKNLDDEYIGLCHYRRYFARKIITTNKYKLIANRAVIEKALTEADVILPKKRDYYIETTYSQYIHAHHKKDIDFVKDIISNDYPEYLNAFNMVMNSTSGHRFNMLVMKKEILNDYCDWLFTILFKAENRINIESYDDYNKRVFGFLAERLLDVWIESNHIQYVELPIVNLENQHWPKKIVNFLKRKLTYKSRKVTL